MRRSCRPRWTVDRLTAWATKWGMEFHVGKCHVMHVGKNNPRHANRMCGVQLERKTEKRDVGVTVSDNLTSGQQCRKAVQTASTVLNQIMRAFHYRDRHVYLNLYKKYVRSHLEFSVAAWAPWTHEDCETLERVQRRAVKALSGLKGQTYEQRLEELGLPSLKDRRKEIDMVLTYKLF